MDDARPDPLRTGSGSLPARASVVAMIRTPARLPRAADAARMSLCIRVHQVNALVCQRQMPGAVGAGGKGTVCHHAAALAVLEDLARDCLIGPWDPQRLQMSRLHIEGPVAPRLEEAADERVDVSRLSAAIRGASKAAVSNACCRAAARALLSCPLPSPLAETRPRRGHRRRLLGMSGPNTSRGPRCWRGRSQSTFWHAPTAAGGSA